MKKIMTFVAAFLTLATVLQAQNSNIREKYATLGGVSVVSVSPETFKESKKLPVIIFLNESLDLSKSVKTLDDFYQVTVLGNGPENTLQSDVAKFVKENGYELMLQAKKEGADEWIYTLSDKKSVNACIFFRENEEGSNLTHIVGRIPVARFRNEIGYIAQKDKLKNAESGLGYLINDKDGETYSFSNIKVKRNEAISYTNMMDYLRGKVAGVLVAPDGSITIRGITSVNSSSTPLFIVDGIELPSIDGINPLDVESVQVLKDASSSIYGIRGANGVIIINTRKSETTD